MSEVIVNWINSNSGFSTAATTLVVAVITGIYVYLTYKLLRESRKANEVNSSALERQFRISTLPHLYCDIKVSDSTVLQILNVGKNPAVDVDVMTIGVIGEDELGVATLKKDYVSKGFQDLAPTPDEEGLYGISDRVVYSVFPFGKKVEVAKYFPITPSSIWVLLQYRDIFGINYSQLYWFTLSPFSKGKTFYVLSSIAPKKLESSERVDLIIEEVADMVAGSRLGVRGGAGLPEHVKEDFLGLWSHSIGQGALVIAPFEGPEGRGIWSNVEEV
jgi:hypothetical protein